jgi:glutamate racemase
MIHDLDTKIKVFSLACPLFVPLAEEGYIDKEGTYLIARDYLQTMHNVDVDTLVLGCTHYPLLKHVIGGVMGDKVTLIGSGEETAKAARDMLEKAGLLRNGSNRQGNHQYYVSDVPEKFMQLATRFLGRPPERITRVDIAKY